MNSLEEGSFFWFFTQIDFYASFLLTFLIFVPFFLIFWQLIRLPRNSEIWLYKKVSFPKITKKINHTSPFEIKEEKKDNEKLDTHEEIYFRGRDFLDFLHLPKGK